MVAVKAEPGLGAWVLVVYSGFQGENRESLIEEKTPVNCMLFVTVVGIEVSSAGKSYRMDVFIAPSKD